MKSINQAHKKQRKIDDTIERRKNKNVQVRKLYPKYKK